MKERKMRIMWRPIISILFLTGEVIMWRKRGYWRTELGFESERRKGFRMKEPLFFFLLLSGCLSGVATVTGEEGRDTREGETVSLECRFPQAITSQNPTYFWLRTNKKKHDNVAIQSTPLESNYRIDFRPEQGRYDLTIMNTSYERDNGMFECRVKVAGTGRELHSQAYTLTVLTPPEPPKLTPGPNPTVTEGKKIELACASAGGSPEPYIKWYRDGSSHPLDAVVRKANGKDDVTRAVLQLTPTKDDDGAVYRCFVWNRAMADDTKMEATVTLNVNYFPRVEVGPENPLRIERDGTATLECKVDAKPKVTSVRWMRNGRFVSTSFTHTIHRVGTVDGGKYTCSADNGLGQTGETEIFLDVLFPPQVTIETAPGMTRHREAEEGESVTVKCNVTANPPPYNVEWLREGHPDTRQTGDVLRLSSVTAESAGTYICRAVNILTPYGTPKRRTERVGNATMTLLVRHKPGLAHISPERPIAAEGTGVTLTCSANPPGWPPPQYRWWRDLDLSNPSSSPQTVLATGAKYTIPSAHLGSEGRYHCQATNEMGQGVSHSVVLQVHQPPRVVAKLQPHVTRKAGDPEFSVRCGAQGKPKPSVRWLKDGKEIVSNQENYDILNDESDGRNSVFTVQSTLRFIGKERPEGNQLVAADRGVYSCVFENEVKRAESSMHLRIEHEPVILHQYNKVAYDLHETAEVVCRVQAYPRPEFQWSLVGNSAPLTTSSGIDSHYDISTTAENNDVYVSILRISNIQENDYGEYTCRIANALGSLKRGIRLQPKGPPDHPTKLKAIRMGHNFVTLSWTPGFDGGIHNTKYFVAYKSIGEDDSNNCLAPSHTHYSNRGRGDGWQEFDCQSYNPCNITSLEQHHSYRFKVKAYNTKGNSNYSEEETASTKVDRIPAPQRVTYDPESHTLSINVDATCLVLLGQVEITNRDDDSDWRFLETLPIAYSGGNPTRSEATIFSMVARAKTHDYKASGRSLGQDLPDDDGLLLEANTQQTLSPRVRVKLCLKASPEVCGDYTEAEIGPSIVKEASAIGKSTLIVIVVICVISVLFVGLLITFCRCRKNQNKKQQSKDYEMETSVRPSIVQQPPPPYYSATGLENKALEHSMDLALDDPTKNPVYAQQNGYGYHNGPQIPHNGGDWVNMGYNENSYSNSNNGGSVNSQDSLWQMKMAAANNANNDQHHQGNYPLGYDPLTHGGYGAVDDYASYPHLTSDTPDHDYGSRTSNNPSRNEYVSDPYGPLHKQKKHLAPHLESPYRDVSGLPDPYMENMDVEDPKPQHMFDESLESGYSTPNSRNRRIIREIIV